MTELNKQTCTIIVLCVFALCLQKTFCDATSDIISALKRQESEIEFLKSRVAQLEENADSGKELHDQERKYEENQLTARKEIVAFTAIKTAAQENIGPDQTITFETVISNRGGGYRPGASHFIAPRNGVYMFSTSLLHPSQPIPLYGELVHNGKLEARIFADGKIWDSGSQTVVIEVQAGDAVWVRNHFHSNMLIHGDMFCSFAGVLLKPL